MKLFRNDCGKYIEVSGRSFDNERQLQELFLKNTNLVPWEIDDRHVMVDEFETEAGPIDNILLDATGQILILETKLNRNSTRREVLAQIIDYASQLTRFGPQEFIDRFCSKMKYDFTENWFTTKIEQDTFRRVLESNLRNSHITMMIVMDKAELLLKDAVRLINRSTHFNCILVEVSVLEAGGREMINIETYGEEAADEKVNLSGETRRSPEPITSETFIEVMKKKGLEKEGQAFLKAFKWAEENGLPTRKTPKSYSIGIPNNGLYWNLDYITLEIWSPMELFDQKRSYLETATSPWRSRIQIKIRPSNGSYAQLSKINPKGATETEFRDLMRFLNEGP